jgi:hypothetical protein
MKKYTTSDLIIIGLLAALGLGTKQIIRPLVALVTVPLGIPGGAVVGGFYMLWLVLTKRLAPKPFSGLLFGITQALVVMILPFGSHGIFTLITYTLPGLAVDLIDFAFNKKANTVLCSMIQGAAANFVGSLSVLFIIFQLPLEYNLFISLLALFTGNLGGILSFYIARQISESLDLDTNIIEKKKEEVTTTQEQLN